MSAKKRRREIATARSMNLGGGLYIELHYRDIDLTDGHVAMRMLGFKIPVKDLPRAIQLLQRELQTISRDMAEQEREQMARVQQ